MERVTVIGAGLAGSEAAWQIAQAGIKVDLFEMRPKKRSDAHQTDYFAELVCSNSLRGNSLENAVGLLKEEMRRLNSLIVESAYKHQVPAGGALAVDREGFAKKITEKITNHPNIQVHYEEITTIPKEGIVIIATGPLTSEGMAQAIKDVTGEEYLYFYDAAAPIVLEDSLDYSKVFRASRYNKGDADYLNCPMSEEEYKAFYNELINAETVPLRTFEKEVFFEGCMPVEVMAKRGEQTLLFGPLKPVGLVDPRTEKRSYAVVQLRQDDASGTMYNLVGFQTHLKFGEQKRVFSMIPGLENAEFVRYGVMHRNTYINSPRVLLNTYQLESSKNIFFAGQITGVEGYVESASSGLVAGINAIRLHRGLEPVVFPDETAHGALANYISNREHKKLQPMNINFGLLPKLEVRVKQKRERYQKISERALAVLEAFKVSLFT